MTDALFAPVKGSDKRLVDVLADSGVVSSDAARAFKK
jgi:hypothetical protein